MAKKARKNEIRDDIKFSNDSNRNSNLELNWKTVNWTDTKNAKEKKNESRGTHTPKKGNHPKNKNLLYISPLVVRASGASYRLVDKES